MGVDARAISTLLALAGVCLAAPEEPDGAIAPAARWTGPHGPGSRSRRSNAIPITRSVSESWSCTLPGRALAPLVHWDGVGFVLFALAPDGT